MFVSIFDHHMDRFDLQNQISYMYQIATKPAKIICLIRPLPPTAFAEMGYRLSPAFADSVLKKYDVRKSGQITVDHFILSCIQLQNLTNAFRARDSALKGSINIGFEDFLATCFNCTA